jgi:aldehyde dehydrogenase (NAD(P)+)
MIATSVVYNASFNCVTGRLLVLPRGWEHGAALVDRIAAVLGGIPPRLSYYPGAKQRFDHHTSGRARQRSIGRARPGELPWTLVFDVDPDATDDPLLREEAFCPVLAVVEQGSADPLEFMQTATTFVNESVWGTLNADCFVAAKTLADPSLSVAFQGALGRLRYGTVGVNHWTGVGFGLSSPAWGGHPSSTLADAQSGIGWVHNTFMLESIEKNLLWGPLHATPKHVWLAGHRSAQRVAARLLDFDFDPSWRKLPGLAAVSLRG